MGKQRVTFKPGMVSTTIRSGAATSFPAVGYILARNESSFETESEGSNGWYKLTDGRGYAYVATYFATIEQITDPPPPPQPAPAPPPPPPAPAPPKEPSPPDPDYNKISSILNEGVNLSGYNKSFRSKLNVNGSGRNDVEELRIPQNSQNFPPEMGADKDKVKIYNYYMDESSFLSNLSSIKNNLNVSEDTFRGLNYNLFHKFNRFKVAFPDYHLPKTFAHVFFTRPDLHLMDGPSSLLSDVDNDPTFYYLFKNNPDILRALTRYFDSSHDFHPFIGNTAQSFELSDEYVKTVEHGETFTGYKVQYGKNNIESKTAGSFSISYVDDQNFSVYKTHKAWIDYISKIYRGEFTTYPEYIQKKILDYACSAYYFLCGPDGETILFWSKYFGVFPTNAPSSSSSWSKGNIMRMPEFSVNYAYAWKEDFSPLSLAEFNMNSSGSYIYKKIYEPSLLATGKTFAGAPFIETKQDASGGYVFKLKFRNN